MGRLRVLLPLVLSAAMVVSAAGCTSSIAGTASYGGSAAPAAPSSSSAPTSAPPAAPAPTVPDVADTDLDEALVCLVVSLAFAGPAIDLATYVEATSAGREPPKTADEVATAFDAAVSDNQQTVDDAPDGAIKSAGQALLTEAGALAGQLRAGGGDGAALDEAFTALGSACETL